MNPCLIILNPRDIRACVESLEALPIPKVWMRGFTEAELVEPIAAFVDRTPEFDHYVCVSDDGIVPRGSLAEVLEVAAANPGCVATGYSNLDLDENCLLTNAMRGLLPERPSTALSACYDLFDLLSSPQPWLPTCFTGMALTTMSRELWQRFPFGVAPQSLDGQTDGWGSDWWLSRRLQDAGIPILVAARGLCIHLKERWNTPDQAREHRLVHMGRREVIEQL